MQVKNFTYDTLTLNNDYEGKVEATFIQSDKNNSGQVAVLYLHGFVDYFFHPHLADKFHENGYNFYALELRKYGHSLLPHQHPNYCKNLEEYFEEIDICLEKINSIDKGKIIFLGHSTGGLIISLYAEYGRRKDLLSALILNSPFLEMNAPAIVRKLSPPFFRIAVKANQYANIPNALSPLYPKSLHVKFNGEWDFNLDFKPIKGFPAYFQWLLAIKAGQDTIKKGLHISIPILLLHSSSSYLPRKWSEDIHKKDVVLNIDHMIKYADNLGDNVKRIEITDGRHDIFLSIKEVRVEAFDKMFSWLKTFNI